jgi:DNA-binding transcriptional MocR family regulator
MQPSNRHLQLERYLSARTERMQASEIREILKLLQSSDIVSLAGGIPDPTVFPVDTIRGAFEKELSAGRFESSLQYSISEGYPNLREWVASHYAEKGGKWKSHEVLITNGSQQALDFLAKVFLNPGDLVALTRPSYLGAIQAFDSYEANYIEIDCDSEGPLPESVEAALQASPKFLYVVSDFQNPTGTTISQARRQAIAVLSLKYEVPVIEDRAYEELYYDGHSEPALFTLGDPDFTIACGTFSKTICPSMRIGWVCAKEELIRRLVLVKQQSDLHCSTINQRVMAEVVSVCFKTHVAKLRRHYAARLRSGIETLHRYLPPCVQMITPHGGFFIWLTLPEPIDTRAMLAAAMTRCKVAYVPGQAFFAKKDAINTIRLSVSLLEPDKLTKTLEQFCGFMAEYIREI